MVEYQLPKLGTRVRFPSLALPIGIGIILFAAGCGTTEYALKSVRKKERQGIYHKVRAGETIWRIAEAYHVTIDDIVKSNNIPNVAHIEGNQLVFIPGADNVRGIITDQDPDKNEFSWPIKGKILHFFGERKGSYLNKGISIQAQAGQTVQASRQGRVVFADYLSGYAYTVILDHGNGYFSVYSRNAGLLVEVGDLVLKGDRISRVGKSGNLAFLHFEIRKNGKADNPLYYLNR